MCNIYVQYLDIHIYVQYLGIDVCAIPCNIYSKSCDVYFLISEILDIYYKILHIHHDIEYTSKDFMNQATFNTQSSSLNYVTYEWIQYS